MKLQQIILSGVSDNGLVPDGALRAAWQLLEGATSEDQLAEELVVVHQLRNFLRSTGLCRGAEQLDELADRGIARLVSLRRGRHRGSDHKLDGWRSWTGRTRTLAPLHSSGPSRPETSVNDLWVERTSRLSGSLVIAGAVVGIVTGTHRRSELVQSRASRIPTRTFRVTASAHRADPVKQAGPNGPEGD